LIVLLTHPPAPSLAKRRGEGKNNLHVLKPLSLQERGWGELGLSSDSPLHRVMNMPLNSPPMENGLLLPASMTDQPMLMLSHLQVVNLSE
jgi:hypothetical protein